MKLKLCILTLAGLVAGTVAGLAQTNTPAEEAPAAVAAAKPEETAQLTAPPATAATTEAPAAAPKALVTPQAGAVIPLIVMDDVPLTDGIRNLARQAGLNHILDPKIGFGQTGADGKPTAQPSVSIRWENITAEQALTALLSTYNLQMVEDPKSKIVRITVKDPAAPDPLETKIYQLKYASPSNILTSVQAVLMDKRSKVTPDYRSSQLVVVATEKEMPGVDELLQRLDLPTKQVLIEARMIETTMKPSTLKGVDWSGTVGAQHVTFGNGVTSGNTTTTGNSVNNGSFNNNLSGNSSRTSSSGPPPSSTGTSTSTGSSSASGNGSSANTVASVLSTVLGGGGSMPGFPGLSVNTLKGFYPATAFLNADGVSAVISFLNQYSDSKVLSAPRTVTLDNEPAKIEATTLEPVINVTAGTANTTGGSSVTYSNLGVILNVTPRISANDYVNLRVIPEVSRDGGTVSKVIAGQVYQADRYEVRRVETRVMIPSANTLVMGGMIVDEVNTANIKVPVLGDLPILGHFFRTDSKDRNKQNLLVFITPTIVQDEDFQPTKSDFLKTPLPAKDSVDKDWSWWDSGKPAKWSKP
jgi:type II secretory pathway component GspD/PulD (secretin)